MRPVLLLPAATMLGLTSQQLEAVLAHELAHILRYDYLVNMLQTVVETLLFYHPAVWWASARIRHERELCCDDLAVGSCGDALCYARALTRLERLRVSHAKAGDGQRGRTVAVSHSAAHRRCGLAAGAFQTAGHSGALAGPDLFRAEHAVGARPAANGARRRNRQALESAGGRTGVHVDLGGARLIHRDARGIPGGGHREGHSGTVVVEATLDAAEWSAMRAS